MAPGSCQSSHKELGENRASPERTNLPTKAIRTTNARGCIVARAKLHRKLTDMRIRSAEDTTKGTAQDDVVEIAEDGIVQEVQLWALDAVLCSAPSSRFDWRTSVTITRKDFLLRSAAALGPGLAWAAHPTTLSAREAEHPAANPAVFNVLQFGAKGDGKSKDTAAIQAAIDAAGKAGGTVIFPAGNYLSGTVRLK